MANWTRFRISSLLILVSLVSFGLAGYLFVYGPGNVCIRTDDGNTLIEFEDIVSVDWDTQGWRLRDGFVSEFRETHGMGGPLMGRSFDLCIDGEPIYSGTFTASFSSYVAVGISIDLYLGCAKTKNTILVDWNYVNAANQLVVARIFHK